MWEKTKPILLGFVGLVLGQLCYILYQDHLILARVVQVLSTPPQAQTQVKP